jgi:hypothetical protein
MVETGEVCIANIGPKERRNRLNFGIMGLAAGALFAVALYLVDAPLWMRTVAFLPFAGGAFGFWQYREKT